MNRSPCNIIIHHLSGSSISEYEGKFWEYYIGYRLQSPDYREYPQNVLGSLSYLRKMDIYKACNISSDKQRDSAHSIRCVSIAFRRLSEDVNVAIYELFTVLDKRTVLLIAYIIEKERNRFLFFFWRKEKRARYDRQTAYNAGL